MVGEDVREEELQTELRGLLDRIASLLAEVQRSVEEEPGDQHDDE